MQKVSTKPVSGLNTGWEGRAVASVVEVRIMATVVFQNKWRMVNSFFFSGFFSHLGRDAVSVVAFILNAKILQFKI